MALVPLIIRWGTDTDNEMLRQCARCTLSGREALLHRKLPLL